MKNKKGMTLVEVIVYVAIFSIAAISFVSYSLIINTVSVKNQAIASVENDSKFIFSTLEKFILNSNNILYPASGEASSTLILDLPTPENDLEFYLVDNILNVREQASSSYQISSSNTKITNLEFLVSGIDSKNVKISFSIENNAGISKEYFYKRKYYNSFSTQ